MHFPKRHPHGNTPMFPAEGEVALMFLKPYTGLLDDGLIEMLNGSIHMQMFCGVMIDPSKPLKKTCKQLKERHPRNKYHDIDRADLHMPTMPTEGTVAEATKTPSLKKSAILLPPKENRCVLKARGRPVLCPEK